MGTNYFFFQHVDVDVFKDNDFWTSVDERNHITKLEDGRCVWNDMVFENEDSLQKCYCRWIHIGKSSCGWKFLLAIYPEIGINNLSDWKRLFRSGSGTILDEYSVTIKPYDMVFTITKRRAPGVIFPTKRSIKKHEAESLAAINKVLTSSVFGPIKPYATYEDFLRENHAIRGPRGLLGHDPSKDSHIIIPDSPVATYDYIRGVWFC